MQKFKQLYEYCQTIPCPPYVERNTIRSKAVEITEMALVVMKTSLDEQAGRGLFISPGNTESAFAKQAAGKTVILIARDLNKCWERFVQTKETMHLFDKDEEKTSSAAQLEELLNTIMAPPPGAIQMPQLTSENKAVWMALACLCPEQARQHFVAEVGRGHLDHYAIALLLRIPKKYVPHLLRPDFLQVVAYCIETSA